MVGADGGLVAQLALTRGSGTAPVPARLDGVTLRLLDASGALVAEGRMTDPVR